MIFEEAAAHFSLPISVPTIPSADWRNLAPKGKESGKAKVANAPQATRAPQLCPLQAVGGEFGPTKIHAHFSLSDLKQIKADLGKFSDDLDNYIDVLQGLGQSFELDWKDIMLVLSQTLTSNEREAALAVAQEFGDTWYLSQVHDQMTPEEKDKFPSGRQAVHGMDLPWDPDSEQGDWSCRHLLTCILAGLR
ncbi:hypothetical protein AAY473_027318 [Plecturocebus cupreus]